MTTPKETAQAQFWRGDFGSEYIARNAASAEQLRGRAALWAKVSVWLAIGRRAFLRLAPVSTITFEYCGR
ncbi:MAG: hypothetical protein IH626_22035 [Rhodospirillales bacterium]|nr:hypothetical protein [Rhodospirillales bacterium]